uniref:Uncharacterized protein n=1 Tax=Arundo donax TaxID=35708 RepID=A0A0A8Z9X1_ARUDO
MSETSSAAYVSKSRGISTTFSFLYSIA